MMWVDYTVESGPYGFTVRGDWPGEVMGRNQDGSWGGKSQPLYSPGEHYIVNENGWLVRNKFEPGDVLMVNTDGHLIKVAADTLEVDKDNGKEKE